MGLLQITRWKDILQGETELGIYEVHQEACCEVHGVHGVQQGKFKRKARRPELLQITRWNEGIRGETFLWRLVDGYSGTVKGYT